MNAVLECTNVRKTYGGVVALHDVNFHVNEGEVLGLVGANGSGKSTLLDLICGVQPYDSGEITFEGTSLKKRSTSDIIRRGISRTFQLPQVARELTVRENVICGLGAEYLRSTRRVIAQTFTGLANRATELESGVDDVCERIGLTGLDRHVERVSFGEMRLIEVARALVQKPKLLLLDEPFPGVDDKGLAGVLSALRVIAQEGTAVVLIDHNVDIVASNVDRIVLLADGEIVIDGDPQTATKAPIFLERYIGVV